MPFLSGLANQPGMNLPLNNPRNPMYGVADNRGISTMGMPMNTAPPSNGGVGRPMTPNGGMVGGTPVTPQVMPRPVLNAGGGMQASYSGPRPVNMAGGGPMGMPARALPPQGGPGMGMRSLPPQNAPGMGMQMPPGRGPGPMMGQPGMGGGMNPAMIAAANAARWQAGRGGPAAPALNAQQQSGVDAANAARWRAAQGGAPQGLAGMGGANNGMRMMGPSMGVRGPGMSANMGGLAAMGRNGDTMLAHINPREAMVLQAQGGSGTVNPQTGLREFWDTGTDDWSGGIDTSGSVDVDMGGGADTTTIDLTGVFDGQGNPVTTQQEEYEPSFLARLGWGALGTVLGGPMLGAVAGRYAPDLWHNVMEYASNWSPTQRNAAATSLNRNLEGQQHISGRNANDFLTNAINAGNDAATQRGLSQGSDNNGGVRSGQTNGGVTPSRSPTRGGSGGGGSGGGGLATITPPPPPPPPPRQVRPWTGDPNTYLPNYGERSSGERLWFNRFF